jgi:SAM-dependent methyltransferase
MGVQVDSGPGSGYDAYYFATGCGRPYRRDTEWLSFFAHIAKRLKRDIGPTTVLDAGCAFGFLVEALRAVNVEAFGVDVSEYAISQVDPATREFCWVSSLTQPIDGVYDLIVCIEVLEHLAPAEAERALDNLTASTGDVLFSSTPSDFMEPSHVNVRPPGYWAEAFARRGFIRDLAFDASFITPWAARYRRSAEPLARVVAAYETRMWELTQELDARRKLDADHRALLAANTSARDLMEGELEAAQEADARLQRELAAAMAERADLYATPGGRVLHLLQKARASGAPPGSRRSALLDGILGGKAKRST